MVGFRDINWHTSAEKACLAAVLLVGASETLFRQGIAKAGSFNQDAHFSTGSVLLFVPGSNNFASLPLRGMAIQSSVLNDTNFNSRVAGIFLHAKTPGRRGVKRGELVFGPGGMACPETAGATSDSRARQAFR